MQGVTVDEENQPKSRNDEEFMNLRPSPNFKHKKYLSAKFEEDRMIEANSSSLGRNKRDKVSNTLVATAAAQPPLPPNPPPPDTPPMIMNLKQEIEDDEYTSSTVETLPDFNQPDELRAATATIKTDQSENVTMCRNFARGTCRKGAACIFAHELILSQLPGVYTFCRNFQNSVCSFPKCKFVHATVFEKEHFFRTGFLPPHTLAHLKEASVMQPPPPPPQSEEASVKLPPEVAVEQPPVYGNAPPPSSISCIETVVRYNAETGVERNDPNIFSAVQSATSTISPNRDWSEEDDDASSSSCDFDSGEPLARKCKNCPRTEIREQLLKNKVEKRARANKKMSQKIARLDKSNAIVAAVLGAFFKSNQLSGASRFNMSPDKDIMSLLSNNKLTTVLEKLLLNVEMPRPDAS